MNVFLRQYRAYSPAFFGKTELNRGNKIILPGSALHELARLRISYPMIFMISNPQMGKKSYCGVLEFSAEEGTCCLPYWMMNNLFLEDGSEVIFRNVTLKKGTFVVLQPHETDFINLSNPKAILEQELTNYSCLMKGDTISINYQGRDFLIDIAECKPEDQICVVEADIEVDFKPPLDYKEIPMQKKNSKFVVDEEAENQKKIKELEQKFKRLDGKALTQDQKKLLLQKEEESRKKESDFDPRKHRLVHGIRNYNKDQNKFDGKGVKVN